MKLFYTTLILLFASSISAKTWLVGSTRTYTKPSQVSGLVADNDTVKIDAGVYTSDVTIWNANNLVLLGIGGKAHLKANGSAYGGKAIWVIAGNDTYIENIEFSLCAVPSHNGAGIRQEGRNLTVSHCSFHDNEDGILAGTVASSKIIIEYSEFASNGFGDGLSHNLYINNIDTLIFRYNYSHHAIVGHELKSRAHVNYILYNRLSDETTGTASRNIDLPNGGVTYLIGNIIEQGPLSPNSNLVGYGLEGLTNRAPHELYAINNTLVNNLTTGNYFSFQASTSLFKAYNNIMAGAGSFISGTIPSTLDTVSNRISNTPSIFGFVNTLLYDYHIGSNITLLVNQGTNPGNAHGVALQANLEYQHPADKKSRCISNNIDIGAFEFCIIGIPVQKSSNALLSPNPAKNKIQVSLPNHIHFSVQVYSATGQLVMESFDSNALDISALVSGYYYVQLLSENQVFYSNFIKE